MDRDISYESWLVEEDILPKIQAWLDSYEGNTLDVKSGIKTSYELTYSIKGKKSGQSYFLVDDELDYDTQSFLKASYTIKPIYKNTQLTSAIQLEWDIIKETIINQTYETLINSCDKILQEQLSDIPIDIADSANTKLKEKYNDVLAKIEQERLAKESLVKEFTKVLNQLGNSMPIANARAYLLINQHPELTTIEELLKVYYKKES